MTEKSSLKEPHREKRVLLKALCAKKLSNEDIHEPAFARLPR